MLFSVVPAAILRDGASRLLRMTAFSIFPIQFSKQPIADDRHCER
jgi:hypothetical protein